MCQQRPFIRYFTIFEGNPNTNKKQNLKVIIVLGVSMLVQGSSGWLLRSYEKKKKKKKRKEKPQKDGTKKLHLNKVKTGYVDKGLKIDIYT